MSPVVRGFLFILIAAVAGGAFGMQYRVMRKYTVANTSLLSMFFATVPIPLIACSIVLPGWSTALANAGLANNTIVFAFGFGWGLGAITYAYGFNFLGMALAASILKGITIAVGSGVPLIRRWDSVNAGARTATIAGLAVLTLGTALAGRAGFLRERELSESVSSARGSFWWGLALCLFSGVVSSCANLGYDRADAIERAMREIAGADLAWKATLVRWLPMYWGGITALLIFMGGSLLRSGNWRAYLAPGSGRDLAVSSSMGVVHFLAQIPYGIGAYYLGKLGTSIGWGANIGMALLVATGLGFAMHEWSGVSRRTSAFLYAAIGVLVAAIAELAYANSLA